MPNDTLGRILTASQAFSGNTRNLKWELKAFLDVPGIDISKTIQISVA
jgi:hypothetical protein